MISIIVPTLNEEKHIGRLMGDLSRQKKVDFEVIIADALSTDKTTEIALKEGKRFSIEIIKTVYRNAAHQRNIGSLSAKGDILVFFDADVRVTDRHFLAKINKYLGNAVGGFTPVKVHPSIRTIKDYILTESSNILLKYTHKMICLGGRGACQIARRKHFFIINGYDEEFGFGEDCDFMKRLSKTGRLRHFPMPVYESPRRYRKIGHMRTFYYWLLNWFYGSIHNKGKHQSWKSIR